MHRKGKMEKLTKKRKPIKDVERERERVDRPHLWILP